MDNDNLIDAYFEGNLNAEQSERFQRELTTDAQFAEEVAYQQEVRKTIHLQERAALKAELQSFQARRRIVPLSLWWFAAAAVLVMGVYTWVYMLPQTSNADLYTAYYQPLPNVVSPSVRGEKVKTSSAAAFAAYEAEDYEKAEKLFVELYEKERSDYSYFYAGICKLQNKAPGEAISFFEKASYQTGEPWQQYTNWYLALAYVKSDQPEKAKPLLKALASANGFMAAQSAELLGKLRYVN